MKKKDKSLQLVQDYRQLNEATIKNKYPLPLIQELIDKVQGAKYFTKLNIQQCENKGGRRVESSSSNELRTIRTLGNVLWYE